MEVSSIIGIYLADLSQLPPLKEEEERVLGFRIQDEISARREIDILPLDSTGEDKRKLLEKQILDGQQAREYLARRNLRLAFNLAKYYQGRGLPLPDLVQIANEALWLVTGRYDPEIGRFSTYAVPWINGFILNHLTEEIQLIHIPRKTAMFAFKVRSLIAQLQSENPQFDPRSDSGIETLSGLLSVSRRRIVSVLDLPYRILSVDELEESDDRYPFEGIDPQEDVLERLGKEEDMRLLAEHLTELTKTQRLIIELFYGLKGEEPRSIEEISRMLNCSESAVIQSKNAALNHLRRYPATQWSSLKNTPRDLS